jgi:hypothetical protein
MSNRTTNAYNPEQSARGGSYDALATPLDKMTWQAAKLRCGKAPSFAAVSVSVNQRTDLNSWQRPALARKKVRYDETNSAWASFPAGNHPSLVALDQWSRSLDQRDGSGVRLHQQRRKDARAGERRRHERGSGTRLGGWRAVPDAVLVGAKQAVGRRALGGHIGPHAAVDHQADHRHGNLCWSGGSGDIGAADRLPSARRNVDSRAQRFFDEQRSPECDNRRARLPFGRLDLALRVPRRIFAVALDHKKDAVGQISSGMDGAACFGQGKIVILKSRFLCGEDLRAKTR